MARACWLPHASMPPNRQQVEPILTFKSSPSESSSHIFCLVDSDLTSLDIPCTLHVAVDFLEVAWRGARGGDRAGHRAISQAGIQPESAAEPQTGLHLGSLGEGFARLPVLRTHTQADAVQLGVWFYYGSGCSDIFMDVGRTLLARNRCHAAVLLEQRAHGTSWREALYRVAGRLASPPFVDQFEITRLLRSPLFRETQPPDGSGGNWSDDSKLAWALNACAHGYRRAADNLTKVPPLLLTTYYSPLTTYYLLFTT